MRTIAALLIAWVPICGAAVVAADPPIHAGAPDSAAPISASIERQIPVLRDRLSSRQPAERQQAAQMLGALQEQLNESAWAMAGLLSDRQSAVRVAAMEALLHFHDTRLLQPFVGALGDRDPRVQCRAVIGIHRLLPLYGLPDMNRERAEPAIVPEWYAAQVQTMKQRSVRGLLALACMRPTDDIHYAIPIVAQCLGGDDPQLCKAMWSIVQGRSLAPDFGRCLSHKDVRIRRGAARMLCELEWVYSAARETLDVAEALTEGLSDADPTVRLYCLLTLTRHRQADPAPLVRMVADEDAAVRCAAVEVIRQRRPKTAISTLCRVATHDKSTRVRVRAAFALGYFAASSAKSRASIDRRITSRRAPRTRALVDVGLAYYWDDDDTGHVPRVDDTSLAVSSLFKAIHAERAAPLPDVDGGFDVDGFDSTIIGALGACGPAARPAVSRLLQDLAQLTSLGEGDVRTSAENYRLRNSLYALTNMGPTPELIRALEDEHPVVRTMAAMALSGQKQYAAKTITVLIDSLDRRCWGQCVFSHTRGANVDCLAMCGAQAVPALLDLIRTDTHAFAAQDALSIMGREADQAIPLLLPVLNDDRELPRVRVAIAEALGTLGRDNARVFQDLAHVLANGKEVESVRVAAAQSLRGNTAGDWATVFRSVARDLSPAVRRVVRTEKR